MKQVMRDAVAYAGHGHSRRVSVVDAGEIVDFTILNEVAAGSECLAVTAGHHDPASTHRVEIARSQTVVRSALNFHAVAAEATQRASGQQAVVPAMDDDTIRSAHFPSDSCQRHVGYILHLHEREHGRG